MIFSSGVVTIKIVKMVARVEGDHGVTDDAPVAVLGVGIDYTSSTNYF